MLFAGLNEVLHHKFHLEILLENSDGFYQNNFINIESSKIIVVMLW